MIADLKHKGHFTKVLMDWNRTENDREMPWKKVKDPYKIWLSEIILQQTRVEQGRSYYEAFLSQFPDIHLLAKAKDADVFKLWEGLGYYSRCKNLIHTAKHISQTLNGQFPDTYESLVQLKGVGPYTAAAIASFAYDIPKAVTDGNVIRVLARFFGLDMPFQNQSGKVLFSNLSESLLDKKNPAEYNQAIMDFGATICKPKGAQCSECPLNNKCQAFLTNRVSSLPFKAKAKTKKTRWMFYVIARYGNEVFVRLRTEKDIWQQLHEFILIESPADLNPKEILNDEKIKKSFKNNFSVTHMSEPFTHILTHQNLNMHFICIDLKKKCTFENHFLVRWDELEKMAFPKAILRFLEQHPWRQAF